MRHRQQTMRGRGMRIATPVCALARNDKTGDVFAVGAAIGRPCSQFGGNSDPAAGAATGRPSSAAGVVIGRPLFPARRQLTVCNKLGTGDADCHASVRTGSQ